MSQLSTDLCHEVFAAGYKGGGDNGIFLDGLMEQLPHHCHTFRMADGTWVVEYWESGRKDYAFAGASPIEANAKAFIGLKKLEPRLFKAQ